MDDNDLMGFVDFYEPASTRRIALAKEVGLTVGCEDNDRNVPAFWPGYRESAGLALVADYDEQVWPL